MEQNPEDSRRLAHALNREGWSPLERVEAGDAALRADSWTDLPQWLRDRVAAIERETDGPS